MTIILTCTHKCLEVAQCIAPMWMVVSQFRLKWKYHILFGKYLLFPTFHFYSYLWRFSYFSTTVINVSTKLSIILCLILQRLGIHTRTIFVDFNYNFLCSIEIFQFKFPWMILCGSTILTRIFKVYTLILIENISLASFL